jgi:hypothetical protein
LLTGLRKLSVPFMSTKRLRTILGCLIFVIATGAAANESFASTASQLESPELNPAQSKPDLSQPDGLELGDLEVSNFEVSSPEISNPEVSNPEVSSGNAPLEINLAQAGQSELGQDSSLRSLAGAQITPVSQLSPVALTDWEAQALESLAQRYDCMTNAADRPYFAGDAITRLEFAASLRSCVDRINTLVTASTDLVLEEDLATVQRLQADFSPELAALRSQMDALESRLSPLEENQFSPVARLNMLSSFNLARSFAGGDILAEGIPLAGVVPTARLALRTQNPETGKLEPVVGTVTDNPPVSLSHSTYLIFTFSRTSQEALTAILAMGNGNPPGGVFSSAGLTSTSGIPYTDANPVPPLAANDVGLLELKYSFAVTDKIQVTAGPRILPFRHFDANLYTDVIRGASGLNFYQSTLANSGLSEAGAIVDWFISPELTLRGGYLARNDAALTYYGGGDGPTNTRRGLFGGTNSILAEVTYSPSPTTNLRLLYVRDRLDAPPFSSSSLINAPFLLTSLRGVVDDGTGGGLNDVIENSFVFNFDWLLSPQFALFGRYSYSIANIDPVSSDIEGGSVKLQAFQFGMAFPDLGQQGALGTLAVVIPFDVVSGQRFLAAGAGDGGTEVDVEAVYFYPLGDHLAVVPTFFATFNSNNFRENPPVYGTTLRLQFLF